MKHNHWFGWIYRHGCAVCKVRQCRYGFRLDPIGYKVEILEIRFGRLWTAYERRWILVQLGEFK